MWVLVLSIFSTPQGKKPQFFQQKQKLMDKFGDHIIDQVWPREFLHYLKKKTTVF